MGCNLGLHSLPMSLLLASRCLWVKQTLNWTRFFFGISINDTVSCSLDISGTVVLLTPNMH